MRCDLMLSHAQSCNTTSTSALRLPGAEEGWSEVPSLWHKADRALGMAGSKQSTAIWVAVIGAVAVVLAAWKPWVPSSPSVPYYPEPPPQRATEPPPQRATMGPLEGGTNRQGGDLSAVGIQVNSAGECSDMCEQNYNCRAMTFVKHASANGGICWLKGTVGSPYPNPSMVSAIKQ
jgi:hypothetical protein